MQNNLLLPMPLVWVTHPSGLRLDLLSVAFPNFLGVRYLLQSEHNPQESSPSSPDYSKHPHPKKVHVMSMEGKKEVTPLFSHHCSQVWDPPALVAVAGPGYGCWRWLLNHGFLCMSLPRLIPSQGKQGDWDASSRKVVVTTIPASDLVILEARDHFSLTFEPGSEKQRYNI